MPSYLLYVAKKIPQIRECQNNLIISPFPERSKPYTSTTTAFARFNTFSRKISFRIVCFTVCCLLNEDVDGYVPLLTGTPHARAQVRPMYGIGLPTNRSNNDAATCCGGTGRRSEQEQRPHLPSFQ